MNTPSSASPGRVITFYSYKGGVGRSFALTNVALQLAMWGKRVLCMDWDLEAPGFESYFAGLYTNATAERSGVIGLIEQLRDSGFADVTHDRFVRPRVVKYVTDWPGAQPLDVMFAGPVSDDDYAHRVTGLNWSNLYREHDFGNKIEALRQAIAARYDYVFIDSRTGFNDSAGVCVAHAPDILVLVHTTTGQSLNGAARVGAWAVKQRQRYPHMEAKLRVLPLLSRIDFSAQQQRAMAWLERIVQGGTLDQFYDDWLDAKVSVKDFISATAMRYASGLSFGESLAVDEDRAGYVAEVCPNPGMTSYPVQTVAALLAHDLGRSFDLINNRTLMIQDAINGNPPKPRHQALQPSERDTSQSAHEKAKRIRTTLLLGEKLLLLSDRMPSRGGEVRAIIAEMGALMPGVLRLPILTNHDLPREEVLEFVRATEAALIDHARDRRS